MKLVRFGPHGQEKPGIIANDQTIRDISSIVPDVNGSTLSSASLERLRELDLNKLPLVPTDQRIGPCVADIGKIMCIGLNYSDHAVESGLPAPDQPILFMKATSSLTGPFDEIIIPKGSEKTDWEIELGVVIGERCQHISIDDALDVVAGYCIVNDVSERAYQIERGGQWTKGKSADTFCPLGPWLVTADEIPDPQSLTMQLKVNGKLRQDGNTKTMIFSVAEIISHLSEFMTLEPGDIISTGTPPGVGMGMKPPTYLKPGDQLHLQIEGLGEQRAICLAYDPAVVKC